MKHNGFTLLEVIIVIIIIGVLASLALPRLMGMIDRAKAAEALATFGSVRSSMERCYLTHNGSLLGNCTSFSDIDMENPSTSPGAHFWYRIVVFGKDAYRIEARENGSAMEDDNMISYYYWPGNDDEIQIKGYGKFEKITY